MSETITKRIAKVLEAHQFIIRPSMEPRYGCLCGAAFETNPGPYDTHVAEWIVAMLGLES